MMIFSTTTKKSSLYSCSISAQIPVVWWHENPRDYLDTKFFHVRSWRKMFHLVPSTDVQILSYGSDNELGVFSNKSSFYSCRSRSSSSSTFRHLSSFVVTHGTRHASSPVSMQFVFCSILLNISNCQVTQLLNLALFPHNCH